MRFCGLGLRSCLFLRLALFNRLRLRIWYLTLVRGLVVCRVDVLLGMSLSRLCVLRCRLRISMWLVVSLMTRCLFRSLVMLIAMVNIRRLGRLCAVQVRRRF